MHQNRNVMQKSGKKRPSELLELGPNDKTKSWINDNDLREFFIRESKESAPISSGAGKGLY
jgi:hypothetical protein